MIKPLYDRVLVKRAEPDAVTAGGIYLPGGKQEERNEGVVVAVGGGRVIGDGTTLPLTVKTGDSVLFGQHSGAEVAFKGTDYLIMREDEILAVVG